MAKNVGKKLGQRDCRAYWVAAMCAQRCPPSLAVVVFFLQHCKRTRWSYLCLPSWVTTAQHGGSCISFGGDRLWAFLAEKGPSAAGEAKKEGRKGGKWFTDPNFAPSLFSSFANSSTVLTPHNSPCSSLPRAHERATTMPPPTSRGNSNRETPPIHLSIHRKPMGGRWKKGDALGRRRRRRKQPTFESVIPNRHGGGVEGGGGGGREWLSDRDTIGTRRTALPDKLEHF